MRLDILEFYESQKYSIFSAAYIFFGPSTCLEADKIKKPRGFKVVSEDGAPVDTILGEAAVPFVCFDTQFWKVKQAEDIKGGLITHFGEFSDKA